MSIDTCVVACVSEPAHEQLDSVVTVVDLHTEPQLCKSNINCATDSVDGLEGFIYDNNRVERKPWPCCGRKVPRSEIVFLIQVVSIFITVCYCVYRVSVSKDCEERTIYISILTATITYLLPPPRVQQQHQ